MGNDNEQKVKKVIQNTIGVKAEEIELGAKLYDSLSVDSTEMVEITVGLEKSFGIKIGKDEVTKFSSVSDIIKVVTDKQAAQV